MTYQARVTSPGLGVYVDTGDTSVCLVGCRPGGRSPPRAAAGGDPREAIDRPDKRDRHERRGFTLPTDGLHLQVVTWIR
ncbi:hypothetical protein GCM10022294_00620 [Dietzia aurantiaca]